MGKKTSQFQKVAALVASVILIINFGFDSLVGLISLVVGLDGAILEPVIIYTPLSVGIFLSFSSFSARKSETEENSEKFQKNYEKYYSNPKGIYCFFALVDWIFSNPLVSLFVMCCISRFHLSALYNINPEYLGYDPHLGFSGHTYWGEAFRMAEKARLPGKLRVISAIVFLVVLLYGFVEIYTPQGTLTSVISGGFLAWTWNHFEPPEMLRLVALGILLFIFLLTYFVAFITS